LSGAPSDGCLPNLIFIGERDVSHARLIALAVKKETRRANDVQSFVALKE
jgi:hypothetical protein